jgi:hypothetical protein
MGNDRFWWIDANWWCVASEESGVSPIPSPSPKGESLKGVYQKWVCNLLSKK